MADNTEIPKFNHGPEVGKITHNKSPKPVGKKKLTEVSPKGWKGTVDKMKDHPEITNPWALSWWMKNKGYKSHYTKSGNKK